MDGVIDSVQQRRRPRGGSRLGDQLEYVTGASPVEDAAAIRTANADLLYEAASELLRANNKADVLGTAVRHTAKLLKTHIAFVMLLDAAGKLLKLEASSGHRTPTFTTIARPVQALTAVGTGKPVQSSDFLNDSRLDHDPSTDDIVRKEGMRTVLAVPLQQGERMLGALYAGHREPRHFPSTEVQSFRALSAHVSAALVRVQDFADLSAQLDSTSRLWLQADAAQRELTEAERIRQAVLARVRAQEGVAAAAVALAECLDRPIVVTDWKLLPIASAPQSQSAVQKAFTSLQNRTESREAVATSTESHGPVAAGRDWKVAPIEAGRDLLGYLWIGHTADGGSASVIERVMEQVTPILALELLTKGDSDRRQRGDFIYELLAERLADFSVLEARASSFWGHFNGAHRPVVIRIVGPDEHWGSRLESARRLVAAARPNDFVAVYGRDLVLLTTPPTRELVEPALAEIQELFRRNRLEATIVVGGACRDLSTSREATLSAVRLHDLLGGRGVMWVEGLEALTHLFAAEHRDRLQALCRTTLAPFGRRAGLLDAVHAYYEAGGNKADAARRLSIHVNTLRQRIERAEQILGGSIDDSVRAVPLRLALLVRAVSHSP